MDTNKKNTLPHPNNSTTTIQKKSPFLSSKKNLNYLQNQHLSPHKKINHPNLHNLEIFHKTVHVLQARYNN